MEAFAELMALTGFPEEDRIYFEDLYRRVTEAEDLRCCLKKALRGLCPWQDTARERAALAEGAGIHPYTADLLVLLAGFVGLRKSYAYRGYSPELFVETLADLRYKLEECRQVYGIPGNFVFFWYGGFFDMTRFKLGRLQYEPVTPASDWGGLVTPGVPILKCHIPAAGPLTPELVESSLAKAYRFYGCTGVMQVYCGSWLLYPPHYELYPKGSNLQKFYDLFRVFDEKPQPANPNAWRVFGTMDTDPAAWPLDTSLQRAFHKYLTEGKSMGFGKALLCYTPERGVFKEEAV